MNPEIFREYDIRGVVDRDLNEDIVSLIGKAIGTYIKRKGGKSITVGRDMRKSSDSFRDFLVSALRSTGCNVIDIGQVPTPVAYFSLHLLNPDGGVMITGSHNPPEFNGFKISEGRHSLYGDKIKELKGLINEKDFEIGTGSLQHREILDDYIKAIAEVINISRPVKFAVDGGNGCFGIVGTRLLKELGQSPIELYCEPDGMFPNHHPDPTIPEYLEDLIQKVRGEGLELGIGFDGDGDRIGVVDDKGNIIWGDQLLIIFGREIIKNYPGATVVGEVKCTQNLFNDIKKYGGKPIMSAAGHSLIKKCMRENKALLAGEMSGHICFSDNYYGFDDATFAACRMLEIVAKSGQKVSEMLRDLPQTYYTPEIRVDCPDSKKFDIVKDLTNYFKDLYDVSQVDGVRINFGDGWALARASNTQPILVLRFEAEKEDRLKELKKIMIEKLVQYDALKHISLE